MLIRAGVVISLLLPGLAGAQITIQKLPPATLSTATIEEDRSDLIQIDAPPATIAAARLAELGLKPNSIMEGETLKLTVGVPFQSLGNLSLIDVGVTSATNSSGWATVRGSVIARFNAQAGSRYLVDFAVGDPPLGTSPASRKFSARIYSGEGTAATVQEFTVPRGSQHVAMIVEAKGSKPSVVLTLAKETAALSAVSGSISTMSNATAAKPQAAGFMFYSVEVSRLK